MSSMATKPSVRLTTVAGSSPRAILQKMQSGSKSGSEDPLLRHGSAPHGHELADGRVDEPRRVVVAVAPAGTVDEHDVRLADLLVPPAQRLLARQGPEPLASLPLDRSRNPIVGGSPRPGAG